MPLTLSTGHTVTFRQHYTHRMENAFKEALSRGMALKEKGGEVIVEDIQAGALDRAIEAVLALYIEKIVKDGQEVPFGTEWLLDLPEHDFGLLRDEVANRRLENETKKAEGEKNR